MTGHLTAAEHEVDAGWFAVGQHFALQAKPGGTPHRILTMHRGQIVEVVLRDYAPEAR